MVRNSKVNLLFVSCQPKGSTERDSSTNVEQRTTSWQKHASREYHRRNALKKGASATSIGSNRRSRQYAAPMQQRQIQAKAAVNPTDDELQECQDLEPWAPVGDVMCSQLDPFGVIIRPDMPKHALQMFQHSYSNQWSIFDIGTGRDGRVVHTILVASMVSPAMFYSNIFAATAHTAWLHASDPAQLRRNSLLQLQAKGLALSHLTKEVASVKNHRISDELLFAMLTMAAYGRGDSVDFSPTECRNVGPGALCYDNGYYGSVAFEPAHIYTLSVALHARGGLSTVTLPGLKEIIVLADILEAFKGLRSPWFPTTTRPIEEMMTELPGYTVNISSDLEYLPVGFRQLPLVFAQHPILVMMRYMKLTTDAFNAWTKKAPEAPQLEPIRFAASACAHSMLSTEVDFHSTIGSPSSDSAIADMADDTDALESALYAVIRYSGLVFCNQVLWPMPRSAGIQLKLSIFLTQAMKDLKHAGGWVKCPEVAIWSAIMGAIVGLDEIRSWLVEACLTCLGNVSHQAEEAYNGDTSTYPAPTQLWDQTLRVCRTFVWYDGAESSLQYNLSQVKIEALRKWCRQ